MYMYIRQFIYNNTVSVMSCQMYNHTVLLQIFACIDFAKMNTGAKLKITKFPQWALSNIHVS